MSNTAKRKKTKLVLALSMCMVIAMTMLSGCAALDSFVSGLKGDLVGNDYVITEYDNFGTKVMAVSGEKVRLEEDTDNSGEQSSYINILIDGYEWNHVGGTLVFAQNGVDMITDFQLPEEINSNGSTSAGLMGVDRIINSYRNMVGKKSIVVIYSQTGAPIGLFQGDKCYKEVPSNLPKTTLLSIDGKRVYIHRANVDIIPVGLLDNSF